MKETAIINDTEIDPKKLLELLSNTNELPANVFAKYVNYFRYQAKDNFLTEEEKCIMAVYLYMIEVTPTTNGNHRGYIGKKGFLFDYYTSNIDKCSNQTRKELEEYIRDMYNKSIERKKAREEQELMEKYPEVYRELVEYRVQKQKTRKHG